MVLDSHSWEVAAEPGGRTLAGGDMVFHSLTACSSHASESAPHLIMRSRTKQAETLRLSPPRSPAPKPDRPTDRPKRWAKSRTTETRSHEERTSRNTYIFCTVRISSGRRQQPEGLRIDQKSMSKNDRNFDRPQDEFFGSCWPIRRNALASWGDYRGG